MSGAGVVSFYGPAIMSGFAENGGLHRYLADGVRQTLFETGPTVWPENHDGWTVEFLDWADPALQDRPRTLRRSTGWRWLQGEEAVAGRMTAHLDPATRQVVIDSGVR